MSYGENVTCEAVKCEPVCDGPRVSEILKDAGCTILDCIDGINDILGILNGDRIDIEKFEVKDIATNCIDIAQKARIVRDGLYKIRRGL